MRANFLNERDYAHGYQKALLDVYEWFTKHSEAIRLLKMYNRSGVELILKGMSENAETMQELGSEIEFEVSDEQVENKIVHKSIKVCKIKG